MLFALTIPFTLTPAFSQAAFPFPAWLVSYPGTTPEVYSTDSFTQSSYVADARPDEVVQHYRELFEAQGLPFQANFDGMGTAIRVEAKECNLLIQIRKGEAGTSTKVTCAAKGDATPTAADAPVNIEIVTGITPPPPPPDPKAKAGAAGQAQQSAYSINKVPHDMPAPPLIWPDWLKQVGGARLLPVKGSRPGGSMSARYRTSESLATVRAFYLNLLISHSYGTKAAPNGERKSLSMDPTGEGNLHGFNYPNGAPGCYTEIDVDLDRTKDGAESSVIVSFSTHDYKVPGNKRSTANLPVKNNSRIR
jgi:hypothetical protein